MGTNLSGPCPKRIALRVSKDRNITGLKVTEEKAHTKDGKISESFVTLPVIFVLEDADR